MVQLVFGAAAETDYADHETCKETDWTARKVHIGIICFSVRGFRGWYVCFLIKLQ